MSFINSWLRGIVVAVIISTIIEMILPEGNIKKYVKSVIGVFIVFTIVAPIITQITGKQFTLETYTLPETKKYQINEIDTNSYIEKTYIENIKQDIKESVNKLGFNVTNIEINIDKSEDNYGVINNIVLAVKKRKK